MFMERRNIGSIAAGGEALPLNGRLLSVAPIDGYLEVGVEGSADGLRWDLIAGPEVTVMDQRAGARNALPLIPDDLPITNGRVRAGTPIVLIIRNPTAGALTGFIHVRLAAVPRVA